LRSMPRSPGRQVSAAVRRRMISGMARDVRRRFAAIDARSMRSERWRTGTPHRPRTGFWSLGASVVEEQGVTSANRNVVGRGEHSSRNSTHGSVRTAGFAETRRAGAANQKPIRSTPEGSFREDEVFHGPNRLVSQAGREAFGTRSHWFSRFRAGCILPWLHRVRGH